MPNPNPRTDQLERTQFRPKVPGERLTYPARVRLPLERAAHWESLTLEQRSALVAQALETFSAEQDVTP